MKNLDFSKVKENFSEVCVDLSVIYKNDLDASLFFQRDEEFNTEEYENRRVSLDNYFIQMIDCGILPEKGDRYEIQYKSSNSNSLKNLTVELIGIEQYLVLRDDENGNPSNEKSFCLDLIFKEVDCFLEEYEKSR